MSTITQPMPGTAAPARTPERPRFYSRQVVTADDLNLAQEYFRNKLRRHNRMLHGFGVVCGAELVESKKDYTVTVNSGYLITPYGDEVCIESKTDFDVRSQCTTPSAPPSSSDPCGCSDTPAAPPPVAGTIYIAVRYKEVKCRPVSVPSNGCSCDDSGCEFSRWKDCYEICTLDHCPDSHLNPPARDALFQGAAPECTACPTDPWVVLGSVQVTGAAVAVNGPCTCRRQVASYAGFWWACTGNTGDNRNPVQPHP